MAKTRQKLFPFLWYAKDAEGAARFYASIFPNSSFDGVTTTLSESPSGPPGSVKVVDFHLFGQRFQAMTAGEHDTFNDAVSLMVECDDQKELDRYWSALLKGGGKGVACGWLIDKYGVRWQITPKALDTMMKSKDKAAAKRATDAMMKMVKIDIATLEAAFDGEGETADERPPGKKPMKRRRPKLRSTEARARRGKRRTTRRSQR
ncbi:MAG: VOC family protein [Myxococcaceae bacterium]|nr:VOC family protein [Myxococcaceae bacterium]